MDWRFFITHFEEENIMSETYADGKPKDCRYCYYFDRDGCTLKHCYYDQPKKQKPKSECDGCPYGRYSPCIGWCTKEVIRAVKRCAK